MHAAVRLGAVRAPALSTDSSPTWLFGEGRLVCPARPVLSGTYKYTRTRSHCFTLTKEIKKDGSAARAQMGGGRAEGAGHFRHVVVPSTDSTILILGV